MAVGLGHWLAQAPFAARPVSTRVLEAGIRHLDLARLATYRGKAVVALDPTEYAKRSRGRGKRGRQLQHVGRVRKRVKRPTGPTGPTGPTRRPQVATTSGYVDVWAGLVLKGKKASSSSRWPANSGPTTIPTC